MSSKPRPIREKYPLPWSVDEVHGGHQHVVDANGQTIAVVHAARFYWQPHPTIPEARAIASAICALVNASGGGPAPNEKRPQDRS